MALQAKFWKGILTSRVIFDGTSQKQWYDEIIQPSINEDCDLIVVSIPKKNGSTNGEAISEIENLLQNKFNNK